MDDVSEKLHHLFGLDLHDRSCLDPLGEFVDGDKQVGEVPGRLLEGSDEVQSPDREGPCDGDGLECLGRQVSLSREELAPFASAHHTGGIGDRRRPVEAWSEDVPNEGSRCGVVAAGSSMDVLE